MGEVGNVVYEMAKDKNLLATGTEALGYYNFIRSNGDKVPHELAVKLFDLSMEIERGEKYDAEMLNYKGSMGNFFVEK